jgi:hypothetical protein
MCKCKCSCNKQELIGFALLEFLNDKRENRKAYMRGYMNKYYDGHKEVILKQQQEQKKKYRETHLDDVKARQKSWYARKKAEKLLAQISPVEI